MLIWHMLVQCFLRSSCDNAPGPRAFIKANFPGVTWRPRFWFQISNLESCTDMIQPCCVMACEAALRLVWPINRFLQGWGLEIWMLSYFSIKHACQPVIAETTDWAHLDFWQIDIYVAGFPCRAFSKLRWKSPWLADPEARQFYAVRDTIRDVRPKATWTWLCPYSF